ncbi:MAG: DUF541 domain-containing protein [Flavobacterium sp.]|nr:MAG: DUF541 domain-containing protein [Flavobacterium sp.]
MKTKVFFLNQKLQSVIVLCLFAVFNLQAQVSGNQVYRNGNYSGDQGTFPVNNVVSVNDNMLSVTVKILMNKKADGFVITLGLNEEDETVSGCNKKINTRISGLLDKLKMLGIKKEVVYVDFISQTKIYDYTVAELNAQQIDKGFEIKKNVIITTSNVENLEKIIAFASDYEIHDVIKVEYYNENSNTIHDALFDDALLLAEAKKAKYIKSFGKRILGTPNATEEFAVVFPKTQYKSYQAFESAEMESNSASRSQYLKKIARKNKTYYYDGVSSAGFDKVVNSNQTEVGIQYIMTLKVSYKIDTSI